MTLSLTLRWRLTLYYALVSSVTVLLSAVLIYLSLRFSLQQGLDASLREAAAIAASQLSGDDRTSAPESAGNRVQSRLPGATVIQIFDHNGHRTDGLGISRTHTPLVAGLLRVGTERVYTARLPEGGWIQVSRSEAEILSILSGSGRLLLLILPLFLLLGLAAGYVLADRALRPVDAVARLARSIAVSGHYGQRVPVVAGQDELARLTQTVNAMLERLAATIEREKAFALAAAHELRTPLSVLQASAELSLERPRQPEQYVRTLQTVRASGAEMLHAIESLLALAHTNTVLVRRSADLAEVVTEAAASQLAFSTGLGTRLHLAPESALVQADPVALHLAVSNLIQNALLYGKRGGNVWITSNVNGAQAVIEVADDGPGLSEPEMMRVQQPFQRGRNQQGIRGSGLGLALVAAIAGQHGGHLKLSKAEAGGLLAQIEFPPNSKPPNSNPPNSNMDQA